MKLIRRNNQLVKVTNGAFKEIFEKQGWEIVEEQKPDKEEANKDVPEEENQEVNEMELLLEKPLSKWTAKETKEFAEYKEIDLTNTKNVREAKEIIKEFLN